MRGRIVLLLCLLLNVRQNISAAEGSQAFGIQVVDAQTGRGVPLVELKTVSVMRFWTDSAGWVAIDDPAFVGRKVYFTISSPGYEFPADGLGMRGKAFEVKPGETAVVKIKRLNLAERLYRITGEGTYADSVKLGKSVPTREPVLNAEVTGQDSAHAVVFGGRIHWFWGDTLRQSYPLGHFWTAGATSDLPEQGGLDPAKGVNLDYFVSDNGFSRPMLKREGADPKWLDGLMVVKDDKGIEHMLGTAARVRDVGTVVSRELVTYDAESKSLVTQHVLQDSDALVPCGHPFAVTNDGVKYMYFGDVYPNLRVKADWASAIDPAQYEGYTCLARGTRFDRNNPSLERDGAGAPIWDWKPNTPPLSHDQQKGLVSTGRLKREQTPFDLREIGTGAEVVAHRGSVRYNAFRKKWIMIATQQGGKSSFLGEVWYAEADRPEGPWKQARRIITHDRCSFYNPVHHLFFDQEGGRVIYFEGTYTVTFSGQADPTPRYEYNQMMYRLDLSDERLR